MGKRLVRHMRTPEFMSAWERVDSEGACRGKAPLWDYAEGETVPFALAHCFICPVVAECRIVVRPAESWFTGVAAGHVWVEGKVAG